MVPLLTSLLDLAFHEVVGWLAHEALTELVVVMRVLPWLDEVVLDLDFVKERVFC